MAHQDWKKRPSDTSNASEIKPSLNGSAFDGASSSHFGCQKGLVSFHTWSYPLVVGPRAEIFNSFNSVSSLYKQTWETRHQDAFLDTHKTAGSPNPKKLYHSLPRFCSLFSLAQTPSSAASLPSKGELSEQDDRKRN